MIQAVIFDMDGLLIDSEPLWKVAHQAAYKSVGFQLTPEQMDENMGKRVNEVVEYWYHKFPWEGPSQKDVEAQIVDNLIKAVKREGKLKPGVHHVLELFKKANIPMSIASSSSNEIIDTVMDTLQIRSFFEHIYSAEHEHFGKPHPAVFITTAGLLGVLPQNTLVFEDAPAGVLAAKAAKMLCIAVPEPELKAHPYINIADIVIDSLEQVDHQLLSKFED